jgi:hypothetical protein
MLGYSAMVAGMWVLVSSYWLVPALMGKGGQAVTVASFTEGDRAAFATTGDGVVGRVANVLGLQGFWAEDTGLHILPQEVTPAGLWILLTFGLMALVVFGGVVLWRQRRRGELAVFGGCIVIGALLGAGIGSEWLVAHVPFFAGYREPQKFAALVALGYVVLGAVGFAALVRRAERWGRFRAGLVTGLLLALPFALTPTMPWAAMGQLRAADYPAGWYATNEWLNQDGDDFQVLFLPWHMYMYLDMSERVTANPARQFFDKPVIVSDNPEYEGVALAADRSEARKIDAALKAASSNSDEGQGGFAEALARQDVKYVLLARESDYEEYGWLGRQEGLVRVEDYGSVVLYRNESFR